MSIKYVEVLSDDEDFLNGDLLDVIDSLKSTLEMIPDEYRKLAVIDVDGNDYGGLRVCIHYERPKTLDEINQDEKEAKECNWRMVQHAKKHYLKLKAEFGED